MKTNVWWQQYLRASAAEESVQRLSKGQGKNRKKEKGNERVEGE